MRQVKLVLVTVSMLLIFALYLMRSAGQGLTLVFRCAFALFGVIALFAISCVVLASLYPNTTLAEFLHWLMPPVLAVPLFFGFIVLAFLTSGPKTLPVAGAAKESRPITNRHPLRILNCRATFTVAVYSASSECPWRSLCRSEFLRRPGCQFHLH